MEEIKRGDYILFHTNTRDRGSGVVIAVYMDVVDVMCRHNSDEDFDYRVPLDNIDENKGNIFGLINEKEN